jgi:3-hydroxymyristoyl/3-hydroxydecanoyl-(acyl carrier protein) dehydratase
VTCRGGESTFAVGADHPSLPGHFPGAPVVPGVVVLERVLALAGAAPDAPRSLAWVKFARPLFPGQEATVRWAPAGDGVRFTVSQGGSELVRGLLTEATFR